MDPHEPVDPVGAATKRVLAAIVFTDAVAFTRKVGQDEELAIATVRENHRLMSAICRDHGGQVLKSMGDGLLMMFESGVQAVGAAIEMQKRISEQNKTRSPRDRMVHRIGIHLGDVVIGENDAFGDGVNIAARLEPLSAPGGICISQTVYDVVHRKIPIRAWDDGLKKLKGIDEPVQVWQIAPPGEPVGAIKHITPPTPANVTIASADRPNPLVVGSLAAFLLVAIVAVVVMVMQSRGGSRQVNANQPVPDTPFTRRVRGVIEENRAQREQNARESTRGTPPESNETAAAREYFDEPTGSTAPIELTETGLNSVDADAFRQERRKRLMDYDFEGLAGWVATQEWARLPVGSELQTHYQTIAGFRSWLEAELSRTSGQDPIRIEGDPGNPRFALVWQSRPGYVTILNGTDQAEVAFAMLKPKMIYGIAEARWATHPGSASVTDGYQRFAYEYGIYQ
ncbi:MAG: adenylate/guanylate cyclase domain-containing protein [Fimbriimonadaceae bacterium]